MTRKLPWLKRRSTGTPQATRSPRNIAPRAKRRRVVEPSSDVDDENERVSRRGKALDVRGRVLGRHG
jgi:hypothetical protein